jgi:hypothetical protein
MTGGGEAVVAHFAGQSPNRQFFKIRLAASEPGARGFHMGLWQQDSTATTAC